MMVGFSGLASAIGTSMTGMASVGAMKKNKGAFGNYLVLSALPGSQGLYGFVGYFLISGKIADSMTWMAAGAIFAGGIVMGLVGIVSSYMQAKVCANGITAIGNGHNVMGNTLVLAVYPELYAILGFVVVFLINGML